MTEDEVRQTLAQATETIEGLGATVRERNAEIESLKTLLERYREALEWYADDDNHSDGYETLSCGCCSDWKPAVIEEDKGGRAKKALGQ